MGFFDNLFSNTQVEYQYKSKSEAEAWMAIIYACVAIDGDVSDSEINGITGIIQTKEMFADVEAIDLYRTVGMAWHKVGSKSLVEGAASLISNEFKPTVFAIVSEMILADGVVTKEEQSILEFIAEKLGVGNELAAKIIEVALIKTKGNA